MKKPCIYLSIMTMAAGLFCCRASMAQTNLVSNPGFEERCGCPDNKNQLHLATGWYNPCNGTPDYFHACAFGLSDFWPPFNAGGFQYPRTGVAHAGIYLFGGINQREYVATVLQGPLAAGRYYEMGFHVNLANPSRYATDMLGACLLRDTFACDHLTIPVPSLLAFTPQVSNIKGNILKDTLGWMLVSGIFRAEGGERFLLIGDFYPDSMNNIELVGNPNAYPTCYYFIDDVFLYEVDSSGAGIGDSPFSRARAYPSPTRDLLWLDFGKPLPAGACLSLHGLGGQLIMQVMIPEACTRYPLDLRALPAGLYAYRLQDPRGNTRSGKVVRD